MHIPVPRFPKSTTFSTAHDTSAMNHEPLSPHFAPQYHESNDGEYNLKCGNEAHVFQILMGTC